MSDPSATSSSPTENPERAGTAPFDATNVAPLPGAVEAPGAVEQAADAAQAAAADGPGVIGGEATLAATSWGGASDDEMAADEGD